MRPELTASAAAPLPLPHKDWHLAIEIARFRVWLESGACLIRDQRGELVPLQENHTQRAVLDGMLAQACERRPVRVIILKDRKPGVSTIIQALFYFLTRELSGTTALTVAHDTDATQSIFGITRRIVHHDKTARTLERSNTTELCYDMEHDSRFVTGTAGGRFLMSGSTINFAHISELPKWAASVIHGQMPSIMQAVPMNERSIIVIESTANRQDSTREFETRWHDAVSAQSETDADARSHSSYLPIFNPWYKTPDKKIAGGSVANKTQYEQDLQDRFGVTDEQLAWRREKIANDFAGREHDFKQEHPATPEEAFTFATGGVFPMLSRVRHDRHLSPHELRSGWQHYRAIDWGGSHPFVCLWLAYRIGPPGLTVDVLACPESWRQLTRWSRDGLGKPRRIEDDAPDALRYAIMNFNLQWGHVHVYQEFFVRESAQQQLSEVNLITRVAELTRHHIEATVADRSRPNSIILAAQNGVPCVPAKRPDETVRGEIEDGIAIMCALMLANQPLKPDDPELTDLEEMMRSFRRDTESGVAAGYPMDVQIAVRQQAAKDAARGDSHPIMGKCW